MKEAQDFRVGNLFKTGNDLFLVTRTEYCKGNRGASSMKLKTRNLNTGAVIENVYRADDKLDEIRLDRRKMQFLFSADDMYTFMDQTNYEQIELSRDYLGDNVYYMVDEMGIDVLFYGEKPMSVELPTTVELKIVYTEPAVQGNTSGPVMKACKMHTGLETQVPLFCNEGDVVKIDTRTGEYAGRNK